MAMVKAYCCQCGCSLKTKRDPGAWIICPLCSDRLSKSTARQRGKIARICFECGEPGSKLAFGGLCEHCHIEWQEYLTFIEDAINAGELR